MSVLHIADVMDGDGEGEVTVRGWVHRIRTSGKIAFIVLRDSSGTIQVTVKRGLVPEGDFESLQRTSIESSVIISGTVHDDERAPGGKELRATGYTLVGTSDAFPITEYQSEELLLDQRHLWVRSREQAAIMRVKATLLRSAREWLEENGFVEVTPPILTQNACEGGTTLFGLKYFDHQAYLSQSAQMYLEALCFSLERVYSITPSFRAEKSRTPRHLTEYWHLELESAWVDNAGNMDIQEGLVQAMVAGAIEHRSDDLRLIGRDPADLEAVSQHFERMRYSEAIDTLQDQGFGVTFGDDLGSVEERQLTQDRTVPLFVTNYPKECKAFYMMEDPEDRATYACADLLAPSGYGEIIGGSEREIDLDALVARMEALDIPMGPYEWYLDLRRYGSVPHSGFGLGTERIVRWVCDLDHIRDTMPFPRTVSRIYP